MAVFPGVPRQVSVAWGLPYASAQAPSASVGHIPGACCRGVVPRGCASLGHPGWPWGWPWLCLGLVRGLITLCAWAWGCVCLVV